MSVAIHDAWDISIADYPSGKPLETRLRFLLRYAILAPSTRNAQPWSFEVEDEEVRLFADRSRAQPVADPWDRELYISLGCALENLLVAAERYGLGHTVRYFPDGGRPDLVAAVRFMPGVSATRARAVIPLVALLNRHTDHRPYRPEPLAPPLVRQLQACAVEPELRLDLTSDLGLRRRVDELTLRADLTSFASADFRAELGHWIGAGGLSTARLRRRIGRMAVVHLRVDQFSVRTDREVLESAPLLGVIASLTDGPAAHVRTGQLLERVWLMATALGLSVQPLTQTMLVPEVRDEIARMIPDQGWIPQTPFRLGIPAGMLNLPRTPRRPVEAVTRAVTSQQ